MEWVFHKTKFIAFNGIFLTLRLCFYILGDKMSLLFKGYCGKSECVCMCTHMCTHTYRFNMHTWQKKVENSFFLTLREIVLVSEVPRPGSHNFVQCFVHWKVKDGVHYSPLLKKINRFILK